MTTIETLAVGAAVAFIVEVVILLNLGRDDDATIADLATWKASFHERHSQGRRRKKRRKARGVRRNLPPRWITPSDGISGHRAC